METPIRGQRAKIHPIDDPIYLTSEEQKEVERYLEGLIEQMESEEAAT